MKQRECSWKPPRMTQSSASAFCRLAKTSSWVQHKEYRRRNTNVTTSINSNANQFTAYGQIKSGKGRGGIFSIFVLHRLSSKYRLWNPLADTAVQSASSWRSLFSLGPMKVKVFTCRWPQLVKASILPWLWSDTDVTGSWNEPYACLLSLCFLGALSDFSRYSGWSCLIFHRTYNTLFSIL